MEQGGVPRVAQLGRSDTTDKDKVQEILDAIPEPVLTPRIVTDRVNSVRNDGPELIEPAP